MNGAEAIFEEILQKDTNTRIQGALYIYIPSRINEKKLIPKHSDVNSNTKDKQMILRANTPKRHYLKRNENRDITYQQEKPKLGDWSLQCADRK